MTRYDLKRLLRSAELNHRDVRLTFKGVEWKAALQRINGMHTQEKVLVTEASLPVLRDAMKTGRWPEDAKPSMTIDLMPVNGAFEMSRFLKHIAPHLAGATIIKEEVEAPVAKPKPKAAPKPTPTSLEGIMQMAASRL